MERADYLIGEVLKEGLMGDIATAVGAGVASKAAFNMTKRAIPLAVAAAKSPAAKAAGRAALGAARLAGPRLGRAAAVAAPFAAAAYVAHKINQSTGSSQR